MKAADRFRSLARDADVYAADYDSGGSIVTRLTVASLWRTIAQLSRSLAAECDRVDELTDALNDLKSIKGNQTCVAVSEKALAERSAEPPKRPGKLQLKPQAKA